MLIYIESAKDLWLLPIAHLRKKITFSFSFSSQSSLLLSPPVTLSNSSILSPYNPTEGYKRTRKLNKMSSRLRLPLLALAALSIGLNIAILGCAGRTLHVYNSERHTSPYFLPIWSSHFDTRELSALIATSILTFLLNCIVVLSLFITTVRQIPFPHLPDRIADLWTSQLPANLVILASTTLSTILSLIALIFSAVLNTKAPSPRDTLQSWTCRWRTLQNQDDSIPRSYDTLCHETVSSSHPSQPLSSNMHSSASHSTPQSQS